jgi:hypothetical protein
MSFTNMPAPGTPEYRAAIERERAEVTRRFERFMRHARTCESQARRESNGAKVNELRDMAATWRARAYHEVA